MEKEIKRGWKFEKQFRKKHPETIGETDSHFDLSNYNDWLESKLEQFPTLEQFKAEAEAEAKKRHSYEGGGLMAKIKANAEQQNFIEPALWAFELLTKKQK